MVQDAWVFAAVQLFITVLVAYDAYKHRDWLTDTQLVSIIVLAFLVPLLGAVLYLVSIYVREKKLVECPQCGEKVHMEENKCPNCGAMKDVEQHHEPEGPYTCDSCGKEFDTYRGLRSIPHQAIRERQVLIRRRRLQGNRLRADQQILLASMSVTSVGSRSILNVGCMSTRHRSIRDRLQVLDF
ncbi:MAG: zinc ribbon domain-containing protein [Candidatus Nanohaloarchaea archaeon]|nr:zinc ribbon domain-containing protein [Candidatus Nanohaloarchaea archaeon]